MRILFLCLILNLSFAIDVKISEELTKIIKDDYHFGLDIAFKKNDRKTSFYVTASTKQPHQIIGCLDLKKDQANIARFVNVKGLSAKEQIQKFTLIPDKKALGLDTITNTIYRFSLTSGEISEKIDLKPFNINSKIYDLVFFSNPILLTDLNGLSLIEIDSASKKTDIKNISNKSFSNASVILVGKERYLILATEQDLNSVYIYENNNLRLLDSWKEEGINGITLLDDAKTIAYLKHTNFVLRQLPEALIVWSSKEWFLIGILSTIMLMGFVFLFKVVFK